MAVVEEISVVRRETMVEAVARALIRYIAGNDLQAGDQLPSERKLVEMTGASRLPLREALALLRGLGIIESRHGKGAFVKQLDPSALFGMLSPLLKIQAGINVRHLFEVRMPLEKGIAALAAGQRTNAHLRALEEELAAMEAAIDDRPRYVAHDKRFHQELSSATGNPVFLVFTASLTDLIAELHERYQDKTEYRKAALKEHRQILEAVRRGDAEEAAKAMEKHLAGALERM